MKKKKSLTAIIVLLVLFFISCPEDDIDELAGNFWAQNIATGGFYRVDAELLFENTLCKVWVEKGSGVTSSLAKEAADTYVNTIYPKMIDAFGWAENFAGIGTRNTMQYADLLGNGDGKLTILLLDIKDNYQPGMNESYVAGYFSPFDFYNDYQVAQYYPGYKTNNCDMLYIDINPGFSLANKTSTFKIIAHEMQHLMNFVTSNLNIQNGKREKIMDTWIDEGLSSAAEWVYDGIHLNNRIEWYNADPSGLIKNGNNFYIWDNHKGNASALLDDYATVYMFFQYLRLQGSNDIYKKIMTSNYYDYRAVTEHFNKSWDTLLGEWLAANYINNSTGVYGYKGDSTFANLTKHHYYNGATTITLYPGEGVFSYVTAGSYTVPANSGVIKYLGIGSTGITSSVSAGGALLTYNANTNTEGTSVAGIITGGNRLNIQPQSIFAGSFGPIPIGGEDLLRLTWPDIDSLIPIGENLKISEDDNYE